MKRLFVLGLSLVLGVVVLPFTWVPAANATTSFTRRCRATPIIAHRGTGIGTITLGGHRYTEDTIPAFLKGTRTADGFETDYWPTEPVPVDPSATTTPSDGIVTPEGIVQVINNHDPRLDRTTNGSGAIAHRTWEYVQGLREDSGVGVATFGRTQQVMNTQRPEKQQQLELKPVFSQEVLTYLVDQVHQYRNTKAALSGVMFTSGYLSNLRIIKQLDPRIQTGLIGYGMDRPAIRRLPSYVDSVNVNQAAPRSYVRLAHRYGIDVSLRRPDTKAQFRADVRKGADQVVTDKPWVIVNAC